MLLAAVPAAHAGPVVRRANGANSAAIQATVDQFRADLGGGLNGVGGNPATGRRGINWDGVPDTAASPNVFPGDFFNVTSARGAVLTTPGSGFQVSGTPARFGNFNLTYPTEFTTFSPQRLFTAVGSTITDVTFRVPGTTRPATVSGFGVVFADVDVFGPTTVEYFNERGQRIGPVIDSSTAFASASGLSFVGVSFDAGERIGRVRITSGNTPLQNVAEGGSDAVVMDDFIYGEPQALLSPAGLDTSFGTGGWTQVNFGDTDQAEAVLVQPDGKIVLAGTWDGGLADFAVLRLNSNGTPDTTFSGNGLANLTFGAPTFGGVERAFAVARQSDGKLVVVGVTDAGGGVANNFGIARLDVDGSLDPTFSGDGKLTVDFGFDDAAHAVAIQADGRIVVAGQSASDVALVRLLADGTLDTSFNPTATPSPENGNGRLRVALAGTDVARAVAVQADGAIVLAGATQGVGTRDFAVVRVLANGTLDPSFDADGWTTVDFTWEETAEALILLPDGRILVGGSADGGSSDFAVARLLPSGALDPTFNPLVTPSTSNGSGRSRLSFGAADFLTAMALQADGRIVLAGYTNAGSGPVQQVAVARLTSEGAPDASFAAGGATTYDLEADEAAFGVALQADGRIVVAGRRGSDFLAMRLIGGPTPGIYITTPSIEPTTTAQTAILSVRGTAGDDVAVTEVTWMTDRGFSGTATGTTNWAAGIPLRAGANLITVTARDASGNTSTDTLTVTVSEFRYYLSEGATGPFFDLDILIANPTDTAADVAISYLRPDGSTVPQTFTLAAHARRTVKVDQVIGVENTAVSAVIRSTNAVPLAVERTMFWDSTYYGGHTGNAVDAPQTRWLFGEGNQGFFDTYVLLANSNAQTAVATVTFLVEGGPNVSQTYSVAPTSRQNVYAGSIPQLAGKSFSIVVTSTLPIIAERSMYFGTRLFEGGHESAGVSEAATSWFHAEGATGPYFDTYILVGNPNPTTAHLTITFLKGDGTTLVRAKQVPANGRFTLYVDGEDSALADTAVSTTVVSDIPVVSERAMYWAGTAATWFEAHNSFGLTSTATRWALAEGRVGQGPEFETYVLIANPSTSSATVRATFLRAGGQPPVSRTWDVLPTSRFNIWVNAMVPELQHEDFGVLIEVLNGVNVAVERALYWKSGGVAFAGGTNATAVQVP